MDLAEQLQTENAYSWTLDHYTRFYAIPCAKWADNQSWKIYVEFNEPEKDGSGLFKRLMFATFDWQGRINASDVIHTWRWKPDEKIIQSVFFYNGRTDCGSLYEYVWDEGTLTFKMQAVRMKSVCDGDPGPWPDVQLPGTPALVK